MRLDDLLDAELKPVSLIKLDVEGWEQQAVSGAEGLIRRHRPTLVIEIERRHLVAQDIRAEDLIESIRAFGYRVSAVSAQGLIPWDAFEFDERQRVSDLASPSTADAYINNFLFVATELGRHPA